MEQNKKEERTLKIPVAHLKVILPPRLLQKIPDNLPNDEIVLHNIPEPFDPPRELPFITKTKKNLST